MKTIRKALGAGAVAVLLSACGGSPTGPAEASGPSYDGGFTIGSANRSASTADSTGAIPTGSAGTEERGGYTMGSGN